MKYIYWITFLLALSIWFLVIPSPLYWNESSYESQIQQCIDANEKWTTRQIEDFLCINWSKEKILYQIILDLEFKEIDDQIDVYLTELEESKNYYFWTEKQDSFIWWINEIESRFAVNGKYWREFNTICNLTIIEKVQLYQWWETSTHNAKDFFEDTKCMDLVKTKLYVSKQVAYNILALNKQQILKDEQKKYVQQERTKYDKLLEAFMINLGYLERIFHKWPSKITNPAK